MASVSNLCPQIQPVKPEDSPKIYSKDILHDINVKIFLNWAENTRCKIADYEKIDSHHLSPEEKVELYHLKKERAQQDFLFCEIIMKRNGQFISEEIYILACTALLMQEKAKNNKEVY